MNEKHSKQSQKKAFGGLFQVSIAHKAKQLKTKTPPRKSQRQSHIYTYMLLLLLIWFGISSSSSCSSRQNQHFFDSDYSVWIGTLIKSKGGGWVRHMMLCCCPSFREQLLPFLRDYDRLQSFAVVLIYIQIGCALIGSLGALYNGVLLINLGIALFALVAIESSSQKLGRTYAVLLFCALLLDISWFILFTHEIWDISSDNYGTFVIFSVKLTLLMQIIGFTVRLSSSLLWIQIYRLGVSYVDTTGSREADFDLRNSFLSPATPAVVREPSDSDDILGGSIYDPAYFSTLFEGQENRCSHGGRNLGIKDNGSTSASESPLLKPSVSRSFQAVDDDISAGLTQLV